MGADPAERTCTRPAERCAASAAAIWERPALWTQTKSSSGTVRAMRPSFFAAASSWSLAKRSTSTGRKSGMRETGSRAARADITAAATRSRSNVPAYR